MDGHQQHPNPFSSSGQGGGRPTASNVGDRLDTTGGMNPGILPFPLPERFARQAPTSHQTAPPVRQPTEDAQRIAGSEWVNLLPDGLRSALLGKIVASLQQLNGVTGAPTDAAPFNMSLETMIEALRQSHEETGDGHNPEPQHAPLHGQPAQEAANPSYASGIPPQNSNTDPKYPGYWRPHAATETPEFTDFALGILQPEPTPASVTAIVNSLLSSLLPESSSTTDANTNATPPPSTSPSHGGRPHRRSVSASFRVSSTASGSGTGGDDRPDTAPSVNPPNHQSHLQSAMFSIIQVEDDEGNPIYRRETPFHMSSTQIGRCLPLPGEAASIEFVLKALEAGGPEITIRGALGWEFVVLTILNFRTFYLDILRIPDDKFPPDLPKDDVIDIGLVLIIAGWISNMIAMRIMAGRVPSGANVALFIDTCLGSLEITVLMSVGGQVDLSGYTVKHIQFHGWQRLFTPSSLRYYLLRVANPVKQRVLEWFFNFMICVHSGIIRDMQTSRISPHLVTLWPRKHELVESALDSLLLGSHQHLILQNPSAHPHIHHLDRHEKYTIQDGVDICGDTIVEIHNAIRAGKKPTPQCSFLFRNVTMTDGVANAISYMAETTPLALSLSYRKGRNPWVDPALGPELPHIGLIPMIAGMVTAAYSSLEHFGSETSPEKIINSTELSEVYDKQSLCVGVWIHTSCLSGTSEENRQDLIWMNNFVNRKLFKAVQAREGLRQAWHSGRSDTVFFDPLVPWTTTVMGSRQDPLSFFEAVGATGEEDHLGVVKEGTFGKSELTDLYEEALRHHREKWKMQETAKPDLQLLGGEIILHMAHLNKETTGNAWPLISKSINNARRTAVADTAELKRILSDVPLSPPRTRRRLNSSSPRRVVS